MISEEARAAVESFDPGNDGLAGKSRELTLDLLRQTSAPFSRQQFAPGHVTCTALVLHPNNPNPTFAVDGDFALNSG